MALVRILPGGQEIAKADLGPVEAGQTREVDAATARRLTDAGAAERVIDRSSEIERT